MLQLFIVFLSKHNVLVCIRHCFLTLIQFTAFCLQKTAETRGTDRPCNDEVILLEQTCAITDSFFGEGRDLGNLFTVRHENFGLTNVW